MTKKRILVITDHMPWGHRSIAKSIYGSLKLREKEASVQIDYAEVWAETGLAGELYKIAYKYFPSSNKIAHHLSSFKMVRDMLCEFSTVNIPRLEGVLKRYKPDLVISAYFLHSHALAKIKDSGKYSFKLWTVVADPWTIISGSFVPGADLNLVYDEVGVKMAVDFGIEPSKVFKTGWWVRGNMYQKFDHQKAREKLGFRDGRPVIFVGGGSLGTSALPKFLPLLMLSRKPVGVVFNAGTDKLSFKMVEEFWKLYKRVRKGDLVQIKNLGWIENMPEVLAGCDIVFGKAGPNFLFDTVACEKPFVSITHIGGQEDGNVDIIREKNLGWVKEKNGSLSEFFFEYLKNPSKYNLKYADSVKKEAEANRKSFGIIWKKVKEELGI